ncbi:MAG: proQ, partial [Gammaproteobacteria bacterium]|nr:proQ [Gammaproteobacteria bacterium]
LLKAHFPACFKEPQKIQPLKVGIKQDLVKKLGGKEDITLNDKACMVSSLSYYVSSPAYHRSVFKDAVRIDLEGQPAGVVTEEEAHYSFHYRKEKLQKNAKIGEA